MTTSIPSPPSVGATAEQDDEHGGEHGAGHPAGHAAETGTVAPPLLCRRIERADGRAHDGDGPGDAVDDTITLDETDRHRRRLAMSSDGGIGFVLSLDAAALLRDGDQLVLDDGRRIVVRAAPEALYEVRGRDPHHLLRLAWHMGNRHLPTQLTADHLRIRRDAVIGGMLRGLGAEVREIEAGFDPEGGAYGDTGGSVRHAHRHAPEQPAGERLVRDHHPEGE